MGEPTDLLGVSTAEPNHARPRKGGRGCLGPSPPAAERPTCRRGSRLLFTPPFHFLRRKVCTFAGGYRAYCGGPGTARAGGSIPAGVWRRGLSSRLMMSSGPRVTATHHQYKDDTVLLNPCETVDYFLVSPSWKICIWTLRPRGTHGLKRGQSTAFRHDSKAPEILLPANP